MVHTAIPQGYEERPPQSGGWPPWLCGGVKFTGIRMRPGPAAGPTSDSERLSWSGDGVSVAPRSFCVTLSA